MPKNRLQPVWTGFLAVFFGSVRSVGVLGQPATATGCRSVKIGLKNRTGPDLRTLGSSTTTSGERRHHHNDATSRQRGHLVDPNDVTCCLGPGNYFSFFLFFFFILFTALYRFMYQRKQQMLPLPWHHIRMDRLWAVSTTVAIGMTMLRDDGRMRGVTRGTPKRCRATHLGHVVCFFLFFLILFSYY